MGRGRGRVEEFSREYSSYLAFSCTYLAFSCTYFFSMMPVYRTVRADYGGKARCHAQRLHDRGSSIQGYVRTGRGGRGKGEGGSKCLAYDRVHRGEGKAIAVELFLLLLFDRHIES